MIKLIRTDSNNSDFYELTTLLDEDLHSRYGEIQNQYNQFNKIDSIGTVVIAYVNGKPSGCGCFKPFDNHSVEIKRMIVIQEFRGTGLARMILIELEKWAIEIGFSKSVLETGIKQIEAIKFYSKLGYERTDNYGQYLGNPNSICMTKKLL